MRRPEKDCNTCVFHKQGAHPGEFDRCRQCLEWTETPPNQYTPKLPFWKEKPVADTQDRETYPIMEIIDYSETPSPEGSGKLDPNTVLRVSDDTGPVRFRAVQALLPAIAAERKRIPVASGVLDYFPAALAALAQLSWQGNEQHNKGEPLHWARGKSDDHSDTMMRHFLERGTVDVDGVRHTAKMAWRALALLQLELEAAGSPKARGAK